MNMENTRFSPPAAPVLLPGLRAQPINHLSRGWGECPLDTLHKLLPFYGILRCSVYALEESATRPCHRSYQIPVLLRILVCYPSFTGWQPLLQ